MKHLEKIAELFNKGLSDNILVESFEAEKIHISSGKLVACDPLITNDKEAFTTDFPLGDFPVTIHKEKESNCLAYLEITFSKNNIQSWELAICSDQNIKDLKGEEIFGYPGQSGMGCMMDVDTQNSLNVLENELFQRKGEEFMGLYEDFFRPYFFDSLGATNQYAIVKPNENQALNMVAFETGYGEGFYGSYIAFDKDHKPVKIISEFIEMV